MASLGHAVRHLKRADATMRGIVDRVGPCRLEARPQGFAALGRAILHQQVTLAAARSIEMRFQGECGAGGDAWPDAAALRRVPVSRLRRAGLSRQKIVYLRDLALRIDAGRLDLEALDRLDDEAVVAALTQVKGIGHWTAQMYLMFSLGRPDVLPVDDLGIRQSMQAAYRLRDPPPPARMREVAAPWRPFRSAACWYLWRHRRLAA